MNNAQKPISSMIIRGATRSGFIRIPGTRSIFTRLIGTRSGFTRVARTRSGFTRVVRTRSSLIQRYSLGVGCIRRLVTLPLLALTLLACSSGVFAQQAQLSPNADYQPQDVVKIVVKALQSNSEDDNDAGIATVFRFASPGNRANTGPLERFTRMIKGGFPDMLNHVEARFEPMNVSGDTALQAVWLSTTTGTEYGYAFQLGLQQSGEYEGMWMTEAVMPLGEGPNSGTRI